MRYVGGVGGGAGGRLERENTAPVISVELGVPSVGAGENAGSIVVVVSAVSAGGASRPHSQIEESRDASRGVSDSSPQQECASPLGCAVPFMWQPSPLPHIPPHRPGIGRASTIPGSSSDVTTTVGKTDLRPILKCQH
jgi:hypothetical protein